EERHAQPAQRRAGGVGAVGGQERDNGFGELHSREVIGARPLVGGHAGGPGEQRVGPRAAARRVPRVARQRAESGGGGGDLLAALDQPGQRTERPRRVLADARGGADRGAAGGGRDGAPAGGQRTTPSLGRSAPRSPSSHATSSPAPVCVRVSENVSPLPSTASSG